MPDLNVKLKGSLYDRVMAEAQRTGLDIDTVVTNALEEWVEAQEDTALAPAVEEARRDIERHGTVPADQFFEQLRTEGARKKAV
jgi:hypothetical protein